MRLLNSCLTNCHVATVESKDSIMLLLMLIKAATQNLGLPPTDTLSLWQWEWLLSV